MRGVRPFASLHRLRPLPIPPLEMRRLVGPTETAEFENPRAELLYPALSPEQYRSVVDFGCGCGRLARRLILQRPRPERYVGLDLHLGMVRWCQLNLARRAKGFEFHHHDVLNAGFNPGADKPLTAPLEVGDGSASLVIAHSVFTHLVEEQVEHYLGEVARVMEPDGVLASTWFLFEKRGFPMMQEFQNALYINHDDPTNAVIFDRSWLVARASNAGLTIYRVVPPALRGFQWHVWMTPARAGLERAEFPPDIAPEGINRPPIQERPAEVGM